MGGIVERDRCRAGAVNLDSAFDWIDQPTEPHAVVGVFLHLFAQLRQALTLRADLQYKVGGQRREFVSFGLGERVPSFAADPRGVGRTLAPLGQAEARGCVERNAGSVAL